MRRLAVIFVTMGTALALTAAPASAHTTLTSASPAKDATVKAPSEIVLTYADPVRLPRVVVTDASGAQRQAGAARAVDNKVTQPIHGTLPNGEYTVGWRVVASDGHPVEGTYTFTVSGSRAAAQPAPSAPSPTTTTSTQDSGDSSGWLWIGLLALAIAAATGTTTWLRRSRSKG
ncbi:copper resistance CopC family protein [Actinomadura formosensis]|uniref:copper resistance CopC family protein n=1 Tax=Actinomadura formosensis TaxID=60706 RepID=UPI00082F08F0|nr:copper resistance CopC family protein [Actinomadura formosensis]